MSICIPYCHPSSSHEEPHVKSTPVILKGLASLTLKLGSGGGSGCESVFPATQWHHTHLQSRDFTTCLVEGNQYYCLSAVTVALTPECR